MSRQSRIPALVFFDVDGTLLDEQRRIPESAQTAIRQLRRNGHLAFLNTGRSFAAIHPEIQDVGFDGIIAANGTWIQYQGQLLYNKTMDPKVLSTILPVMEKSEIDVWMEGPEHVYFESLTSPSENVVGYIELFSVLPGVSRDWHEGPIVTNKLSYRLRPQSRPEPGLSLLRQHYTIVHKDPDPFGEVIPKGHSKATGIVFMLERLGCRQDQTYAFGDSLNDVDMLTFAGVGIAMGGSRGTVLRASNHVTDSPAEDGIAKALRHFGLI